MLLATKMPGISGAGLMNDRFSADDSLRMDASARIPRPIDLAHTPPFQLGDADVLPASREVFGHGESAVLEPLVMQVLVALHSARGETLSRDDLIDACWGGRAVTDDALNRVITRLRALARQFGGFEVKTITKVGYRLVDSQAGQGRTLVGADRRGQIGRRAAIAGVGAAAMMGAALMAWRQRWQHSPPAKAADFLRKGEITLRQGFPNGTRQAISFYRQAVQIDPQYAEAWGAMALAYTHVLEGYSEAEMGSIPGELRSAARRALELDPENADAQLALILVNPTFRNWRRMETELVQFNQRHRGHWLGMGRLGALLFDVGRIEDGIATQIQVLGTDANLPIGEAYLVNAMTNTDRLQEAEARLDRAEDRWPGHPTLWVIRYRLLMFNGRPQAAAAFVMNPDLKPTGMTDADIAPFLRLAEAVDTKLESAVEKSVQDFRDRAAANVHNIPTSAAVFALLGRPDLAFASLERYFFNGGNFGPPVPIDPLARRYARDLFSRPLAPLRSDPRFGSILQRIGLEDYWRQTGTLPDFRRLS
jgi:DNA-binding winged helix-turn-helix (wHTH) protein